MNALDTGRRLLTRGLGYADGALDAFEAALMRVARGQLSGAHVRDRLKREMDRRSVPTRRGRRAPRRYFVRLAPSDLERLRIVEPDVEQRCLDALIEHAIEQGWTPDPQGLVVQIDADPRLPPCRFTVSSEALPAMGGGASGAGPRTAHRGLALLALGDTAGVVGDDLIPLTTSPFTIGRDDGNDLVLPGKHVPRRVLELAAGKDVCGLRAVTSAARVHVNGKPLTISGEGSRLRPGGRLTIATKEFTYEFQLRLEGVP